MRSDTGGQTSQTEVKLGGRNSREVRGHSEEKTKPFQAVWAGLCIFCFYCSISIVRSGTEGQTSQTEVKLAGRDP